LALPVSVGDLMSELTVTLSDEARQRLEALAARMDLSLGDCLHQAIAEFVESWEDHLRVVAALQEDEIRPILRPVTADTP